eukprot:2634106-Rhodomonas_salina.1
MAKHTRQAAALSVPGTVVYSSTRHRILQYQASQRRSTTAPARSVPDIAYRARRLTAPYARAVLDIANRARRAIPHHAPRQYWAYRSKCVSPSQYRTPRSTVRRVSTGHPVARAWAHSVAHPDSARGPDSSIPELVVPQRRGNPKSCPRRTCTQHTPAQYRTWDGSIRYGSTGHGAAYAAPRNRKQETAISVQFVPGMRFLVIDFGGMTVRDAPAAVRSMRYGSTGHGASYAMAVRDAPELLEGPPRGPVPSYRPIRYLSTAHRVAPYASSVPVGLQYHTPAHDCTPCSGHTPCKYRTPRSTMR